MSRQNKTAGDSTGLVEIETWDFIGNWSVGSDSFAADPPNAVLVLDDEEQSQGSAVIELFNPEYDSDANTLRFDITARNATTTTTTTSSIDLPSEFGQSTLVIDTDDVYRVCVIDADC